MKNLKTFSAKKDQVERKWYLVDANGKTLGRVATKIASILRGKNKPEFTPSMDTGDFVVVINAEKVAVTGKKEENKIYYSHSGYPGGIKATSLADMRNKHPERILYNAVKGMLPHGSLGSKQLTKLKICIGDKHNYQAQKPELIEV